MSGMLLLNVSNYPERPIYPYAFVQLRAIGRKYEIGVQCLDLLHTQRADWARVVGDAIRAQVPSIVGVHLRQADSLVYSEYDRGTGSGYHPVEDTAELLRIVKSTTGVPTIVGGFGFTTHARALFERFDVSYGMIGEPDAFFERFDDVVAGRDLELVDNLMFRRAGSIHENRRTFYGPLDAPEYDSEVLAEITHFYAASAVRGPAEHESVAVEVARGCPYRCYFCTEPAVKGRRVRVRDLDAVARDVEFLVRNGRRRFWMVCSELNPGHARHARELATRLLRIREAEGVPFVWHAYHLPRWLGREDLELLARSGFVGGWNDFPSFDDENLEKSRVPYRARQAIDHVRTSLQVLPPNPYGGAPRFSMFLGNAYATPETIARSLEAYHAANLHEAFDTVDIAGATRLFLTDPHPPEDARHAETFTRSGRTNVVDPVHPTFYRAAALENAAGGKRALAEIFEYIAGTLLTRRAPAGRRAWSLFLGRAARPEWVAQWLSAWRGRALRTQGFPERLARVAARAVEEIVACETGAALRRFEVRTKDPELADAVALALAGLLMQVPAPRTAEVLAYLAADGLPADLDPTTSYALLRQLLRRFDSEKALCAALGRDLEIPEDAVELFRLRCVLFARDIRLSPALRPFVVPPEVLAERDVAVNPGLAVNRGIEVPS